MKLEAGKYYRTRGGDKALVKYVCEDPPQEAKEDERTCFGFIWKDGGECFSDWSWVRSGEWIPWERNPEDLVSEWTEPEKEKKLFQLSMTNKNPRGDGYDCCEIRTYYSMTGALEAARSFLDRCKSGSYTIKEYIHQGTLTGSKDD